MVNLGAPVQPEYIGRAASACIPVFYDSGDYCSFSHGTKLSLGLQFFQVQ